MHARILSVSIFLVAHLLAAGAMASDENERPSASLVIAPECSSSGVNQDQLAGASELLDAVSRFRSLPIRQPVESCVLERSELREKFLHIFERDSDLEQLRREGELLKLLGFIEPDIDFIDFVLRLLEEEVVGFYDQEDERLFVVPSDSAQFDRMTIAHEMVHALQDQSFPLDELINPAVLIADPSMARSSLVEGDAIIAGFAVAAGNTDPSQLRPAILRRMGYSMWQTNADANGRGGYLMRALLAPYAAGTTFVAELIERGGWEAVDDAFEDLPQSSEQILHPERYIERDEPTWVEFGTLSDVCETRHYVDVRGEFDIRNMLAEMLNTSVVDEAMIQAAQGWDGDRLEIWNDCFGGAQVVVHGSVWDGPSEASEYAEVAARAFRQWLAGASVESADSAVVRRVSHDSGHGERYFGFVGERGFVLERWGDQAVLAFTAGMGALESAQLTGIVRNVSNTLGRFAYPPDLLRVGSGVPE